MFEHGFPPEWSTFKKIIWLVGSGIAGAASGIWKTVTGTLIHITDALASPMQKCEVTLEPIQSGSGDPSPTNVRPIAGWTGCEVTRTGKNLFDNAKVLPSTRMDGGKVGAHNSYNLFVVPVKENTTYTFNHPVPVEGYPIFGLSSEYPTIGTDVYYQTNIKNLIPQTFNSYEYKYALFAVYKTAGNDFSVAVGTDAIPVDTPYQGTTISVTFPDSAGTVYGGTVDLVSGVLTVDRYFKTLTGAEGYGWAGSFWTDKWVSSAGAVPNGTASPIAVCSHFPCGATAEFGVAAAKDTRVGIPKKPDLYTDTASVNAWLATQYANGTPVQFAAAITPITYQLTPQEISTLQGVNNVWSNTNGDTTIIYKAQAE